MREDDKNYKDPEFEEELAKATQKMPSMTLPSPESWKKMRELAHQSQLPEKRRKKRSRLRRHAQSILVAACTFIFTIVLVGNPYISNAIEPIMTKIEEVQDGMKRIIFGDIQQPVPPPPPPDSTPYDDDINDKSSGGLAPITNQEFKEENSFEAISKLHPPFVKLKERYLLNAIKNVSNHKEVHVQTIWESPDSQTLRINVHTTMHNSLSSVTDNQVKQTQIGVYQVFLSQINNNLHAKFQYGHNWVEIYGTAAEAEIFDIIENY